MRVFPAVVAGLAAIGVALIIAVVFAQPRAYVALLAFLVALFAVAGIIGAVLLGLLRAARKLSREISYRRGPEGDSNGD